MISDGFLEQLRTACPLEEIARTYVDLKRRAELMFVTARFIRKRPLPVRYFPTPRASIVLAAEQAGM